GSRWTSSRALETSIPTGLSTESSRFMAKSLPCGCELAPGSRPGRLRRLFGLVRRDRRRSGFSPASEDLGGIDLSPAAAGVEASLRSAPTPADVSMWPEVRPEFNIQGGSAPPSLQTARILR